MSRGLKPDYEPDDDVRAEAPTYLRNNRNSYGRKPTFVPPTKRGYRLPDFRSMLAESSLPRPFCCGQLFLHLR